MSGIKRRMMRKQRKKGVTVTVGAYIEGGELNVGIIDGNWHFIAGFYDSKLPDCDLPWLRDKLIDRLSQSGLYNHGDIINIAELVIKEQQPTLLMSTTKGKNTS
ncbi:hypothetical protein ES703_44932 [subsurface metagenome]